MPLNQLQMMKLLVNQSLYAQGLQATQTLGTLFDGVARHTREGYAFQGLAAREGFRGRRARAATSRSATWAVDVQGLMGTIAPAPASGCWPPLRN